MEIKLNHRINLLLYVRLRECPDCGSRELCMEDCVVAPWNQGPSPSSTVEEIMQSLSKRKKRRRK